MPHYYIFTAKTLREVVREKERKEEENKKEINGLDTIQTLSVSLP